MLDAYLRPDVMRRLRVRHTRCCLLRTGAWLFRERRRFFNEIRFIGHENKRAFKRNLGTASFARERIEFNSGEKILVSLSFVWDVVCFRFRIFVPVYWTGAGIEKSHFYDPGRKA